MKVVALHTDFRIYWPARLKALGAAFNARGDEFAVVEIAGKGSPYAFAKTNVGEDSLDWQILFPEDSPETLDGATVRQAVFAALDRLWPDVIIAGAIAFASGANAVAWAARHGARVVIFDDTKAEINKRNGLVNLIKQSVYNGVDAMLYPAEAWVETGQRWGFDKEQCYFGVDVVDNDFWSVRSTAPDAEILPVCEAGPFFLTVGRLIKRKNIETLLKAFAIYASAERSGADGSRPKSRAGVNLLIVGDGPEKEALEALAHDLSIDSRVTFAPFMSQEELRWYFQNCRAFVLPSHEETWGLVINEAMAAGAPVVASRQCGAAVVLVTECENGYLFDHDDPETLGKILVRIAAMDTGAVEAMRQRNRQKIADWGLPRFCQGCIDATDFVIKRKRKNISLLSKLVIRYWKGRYRPK